MEKATKVLLVDDDRLILYVKSKMLAQQGYDVYTSESAVDINSQIRKYAPDIIIMDHNMPDVSGMEAIKQLKGDEATHSIPVIYYSLVDDLEELSKEAGADAYALKSSTTKHLTDIIESLLKCPVEV